MLQLFLLTHFVDVFALLSLYNLLWVLNRTVATVQFLSLILLTYTLLFVSQLSIQRHITHAAFQQGAVYGENE